jgi:hypothetical protein
VLLSYRAGIVGEERTAVQTVLVQRRKLSPADLYEEPLTHFGANAVERWFSDDQRADLLQFVNSIAAIGA